MQSQKSLISEAKLRIRGIAKEIADLKREQRYLEWLVENDEYLTAVKQQKVSRQWKSNLKRGQKKGTRLLKSALGGVRTK